MVIPLLVNFMGSHSYNQYNPNAHPNSSMSGPHSQVSYCPPPGYSTHGPTQSGPPPPDDGTGRYYPSQGYHAFPAPNHGGPMAPRSSNSGLLPLIQYVNESFLCCRTFADLILLSAASGSSLSASEYVFHRVNDLNYFRGKESTSASMPTPGS